jgi:hypothetical protein
MKRSIYISLLFIFSIYASLWRLVDAQEEYKIIFGGAFLLNLHTKGADCIQRDRRK